VGFGRGLPPSRSTLPPGVLSNNPLLPDYVPPLIFVHPDEQPGLQESSGSGPLPDPSSAEESVGGTLVLRPLIRSPFEDGVAMLEFLLSYDGLLTFELKNGSFYLCFHGIVTINTSTSGASLFYIYFKTKYLIYLNQKFTCIVIAMWYIVMDP